ncbi:28343_t:CDS:1, partial [Racocetra persica]
KNKLKEWYDILNNDNVVDTEELKIKEEFRKSDAIIPTLSTISYDCSLAKYSSKPLSYYGSYEKYMAIEY